MHPPGDDWRPSRRTLLERAIVLVGGAAALSSLDACAPANTVVFDAVRKARLTRVLDLLIPATDTPGAVGAGVPEFFGGMMANWASAETRAKYVRVLDEIDQRAKTQFHNGFDALEAAQQQETLRLYDSEKVNGDDDAYRSFKTLALLGYYHSQIGATQELHYELVPGHWIADAPLAQIGRTWA